MITDDELDKMESEIEESLLRDAQWERSRFTASWDTLNDHGLKLITALREARKENEQLREMAFKMINSYTDFIDKVLFVTGEYPKLPPNDLHRFMLTMDTYKYLTITAPDAKQEEE